MHHYLLGMMVQFHILTHKSWELITKPAHDQVSQNLSMNEEGNMNLNSCSENHFHQKTSSAWRNRFVQRPELCEAIQVPVYHHIYMCTQPTLNGFSGYYYKEGRHINCVGKGVERVHMKLRVKRGSERIENNTA